MAAAVAAPALRSASADGAMMLGAGGGGGAKGGFNGRGGSGGGSGNADEADVAAMDSERFYDLAVRRIIQRQAAAATGSSGANGGSGNDRGSGGGGGGITLDPALENHAAWNGPAPSTRRLSVGAGSGVGGRGRRGSSVSGSAGAQPAPRRGSGRQANRLSPYACGTQPVGDRRRSSQREKQSGVDAAIGSSYSDSYGRFEWPAELGDVGSGSSGAAGPAAAAHVNLAPAHDPNDSLGSFQNEKRGAEASDSYLLGPGATSDTGMADRCPQWMATAAAAVAGPQGDDDGYDEDLFGGGGKYARAPGGSRGNNEGWFTREGADNAETGNNSSSSNGRCKVGHDAAAAAAGDAPQEDPWYGFRSDCGAPRREAAHAEVYEPASPSAALAAVAAAADTASASAAAAAAAARAKLGASGFAEDGQASAGAATAGVAVAAPAHGATTFGNGADSSYGNRAAPSNGTAAAIAGAASAAAAGEGSAASAAAPSWASFGAVADAAPYLRWEVLGGPFFDPATSTVDKGRFRVRDARRFLPHSMRRAADALATGDGVTLLLGRRAEPPHVEQAVTVMFDRGRFNEREAREWWGRNRGRFVDADADAVVAAAAAAGLAGAAGDGGGA
ncbi:unnamed protein product [Phaeothamnion confervicola]